MRARALVVALASCGRLGLDVACSGCDGRPRGPNNVAFVTSTTHAITSFGSDLSGADAICNMRASEGGLPGRYVAYASTSMIGARDRLAGSRAWVRVDGAPFADNISDLIAGRVLNPLRIDEQGRRVAPLSVATATDPTGTLSQEGCTNFTLAAGTVTDGLTTGTSFAWSSVNSFLSCAMSSPIYCFGIGLDGALSYARASGRRAFVTDDLWTVGGGLASADAFCASEAAAVGLSGTFRALLSTTTATGASRFSTSGSTWVRVDGVPLATSAIAFMSSNLESSLHVTQSGAYVSGPVATGMLGGPQALGGRTCADWTSSTDTGGYEEGFSERADMTLFDAGGASPCANGGRLYCLEP